MLIFYVLFTNQWRGIHSEQRPSWYLLDHKQHEQAWLGLLLYSMSYWLACTAPPADVMRAITLFSKKGKSQMWRWLMGSWSRSRTIHHLHKLVYWLMLSRAKMTPNACSTREETELLAMSVARMTRMQQLQHQQSATYPFVNYPWYYYFPRHRFK